MRAQCTGISQISGNETSDSPRDWFTGLGQREKLLGAFVLYPLLFKILGGGMWALLGGFTVMACSLATRSAIASFLVVVVIKFGVPYFGCGVFTLSALQVLAPSLPCPYPAATLPVLKPQHTRLHEELDCRENCRPSPIESR